jgi:tetratricopeptide (TPR) repeat protein
MAVALVDGHARLTVEGRDLGPAVLQRLEIEWPEVTALPSVPGGNGIRKRRGLLRAASLFVAGDRLRGRLEEAALPTGIERLGIALESGGIALFGHAVSAGQAADFTARLMLTAGQGRALRIGVADVAVDGPPPLPLETIAARALTALGAPRAPGAEGAEASEGSEVEIDVLEPALDETLVAAGWRLPDGTDLRLVRVTVSAEGVTLAWARAGTETPAEVDEAATLRRAMEAAMGDERAELAHRLAGVHERAGDEDSAVAALRICIDSAGPGTLVGRAWQRLVELYARRGDPHAAARALIASADDTRTGALETERAATLVAAAEILRKRLALRDDAGMLLERAIALDPGSMEALEALEAVAAEAGDFARLADVLERRLQVGARGPVEQQAILGRLAQLYAGPLAAPDRARDAQVRAEHIGTARESSQLRRMRAGAETPAGGVAPTTPPPATAPVPPVAAPPSTPSEKESSTASASGYAALGESAEAGGDLEGARQAYWRAASIEAEPTVRANYLVAHARVLLARGEIKNATTELETALASAPRHAGALALAADIAYRTHDWVRARDLYAALESVPDAADVIPRESLVHHRAALAHRVGELNEASALYRELAILNPLQIDARRALAELAHARGDLAGAAQRWEEVLRLVPATGGTAELLDARQRLGTVYAELGEWSSARYYLELVMTQDPGRTAALEILLEAYEQLDLPEAAVEACGRLARLHVQPAKRAAALYRQAEILRTRMGDPAGALDAYLRSSDLDPRFVPSRIRLVDHFWTRADLDVVADLANDLASAQISAEDHPDLVARLTLATIPIRGEVTPRIPFAAHPGLATATARALADVATNQQEVEGRPVDAVDSIVMRARSWARTKGESALVRALVELVMVDPTRPGPLVALGRLAELAGRRALASAAFALAAFVAPDGPAARHLGAVVQPGAVRADALRVGGPVDHPDLGTPARRALASLAPALLGFEAVNPAPKPTVGSGLPPSRATELRRIGNLIGAPPFVVAPDVIESGAPDDRRRLRVVLTHPAALMVGSAAATLSEQTWSFIAGRALETLRSGLWTAGLAGGEGLSRLLEGAKAALTNTTITTDDERARAISEWLRKPQATLALGSPEARADILADVEASLAAMPDWTTFTRGARHTRNRIGLLACANPSAALAMLKAEDRDAPGNTPEARRAFLSGAFAQDLVAFMLSPVYENAFA